MTRNYVNLHFSTFFRHAKKSRKLPRLLPQDQDLTVKTKTKTPCLKTKTKTSVSVLEAPRDQDPSLEDYTTANYRSICWECKACTPANMHLEECTGARSTKLGPHKLWMDKRRQHKIIAADNSTCKC